jgi:hypothetical protein
MGHFIQRLKHTKVMKFCRCTIANFTSKQRRSFSTTASMKLAKPIDNHLQNDYLHQNGKWILLFSQNYVPLFTQNSWLQQK